MEERLSYRKFHESGKLGLRCLGKAVGELRVDTEGKQVLAQRDRWGTFGLPFCL